MCFAHIGARGLINPSFGLGASLVLNNPCILVFHFMNARNTLGDPRVVLFLHCHGYEEYQSEAGYENEAEWRENEAGVVAFCFVVNILS